MGIVRKVRLQHPTKWWEATATATTYTARWGANGTKKGQTKNKPAHECAGGSPFKELEKKKREQITKDGYIEVSDTTEDDGAAPVSQPEPTPPVNKHRFVLIENADVDDVVPFALTLAVPLGFDVEPASKGGFHFVHPDGTSVFLPGRNPVHLQLPRSGAAMVLGSAIGAHFKGSSSDEFEQASYDMLAAIAEGAETLGDEACEALREHKLLFAALHDYQVVSDTGLSLC